MARHKPKVGLVLGGGGILGAAWLIGSLHALAATSGWDPTQADYVVGTSAGSVVGALVASGLPPEFLLRHQRGDDVESVVEGLTEIEGAEEIDRRLFRPAGLPRPFLGSPALAFRSLIQPWKFTPAAAAIGWMWQGFLSTEQIGELIRRVVPTGWGAHPNLWIVAVDYRTGRRVAFGRPGAPETHLHRAVEASCAIPAFYRPVRIEGRPYVDGGAWSPSNADVLARTDVDVILAFNPTSSLSPGLPTNLLEMVERRVRTVSGRMLGREVRRLREAGKRVLLVQPEAEDLSAMGVNLMNARRRRLVLETAISTATRRLTEPDAKEILASLG